MKNIRYGLFETNSSSVHTITLCADTEYEKFKNGELFLDGEKLVTKDDVVKRILRSTRNYSDTDGKVLFTEEKLNNMDRDEFAEVAWEYVWCEDYEHWPHEYAECYEEEYTTPGGEKVMAFGYYGHD